MTGAHDGRVGDSPARVGGIDRVTGRQVYVADIRLERVLHAKLVTIDCARARIREIDVTAALAVPGVRLAISAADLPQPVPRFGPQFRDRPVIAVGETHYHGEPVVAIAAETLDAAEEAARLVRIDYEELPAVVTIADALAAGAPLVQDPALRPGETLASTNILREHHYGWGDVDAAPADVVVEGTYRFPMVTQFAIEPHAFIAAPDGDGIAVWSSIQHPNWLQRVVAGVLGMPLAKVRIFAPDPGGGFGGKQHAKYEPLVAFMALRAGRPVRLVLTLEETFQAVRRGASEIRVRTGFRKDGTLAFRDVDANYLIGAYADIADRTVAKGSYTSGGPYLTPSMRIVARSVLSHTTPSTAFRGFGNPQQIWAVESNMDEAAVALGIDPLELRLRNLAKPGDAFIPGDTPADGDWAVTVRRAAELIGWGSPVPTGRGRGIAVGLKSGPTTGLSYATVRLLADGSVIVHAGTSDMGQGARTIFAQIAAQELGAPLDWVTVVMGDTAVVPYDQQTSASRSSVLMGTAVLNGCRAVQAKLRTMAARLESVDEAAITVDRGEVRIARPRPPDPRRPGPWAGAARRRGHRHRRDAQGGPGGPPARRDRRVLRVQLHGGRGRGRPGHRGRGRDPARDRLGRRQGAPSGPGPRPGRGGRRHGARAHLHGADPARRRRSDPEPRRHRLPDPDEHGPAAPDGERERRARRWTRPVRLEGDERGSAVECRAGRGRRRPRCDRRRHPRPATESGAGLARAARRRERASSVTLTYALDAAHGLSEAEVRFFIGGKAANLGVMARDLGLPVPPGFVITTEACRTFLATGWPAGLDEELRERMGGIGATLGRGFGDATDPLLVSVRSGAPVSMPGMMDTILDLGLDDATTAGLARVTGDEAFARSCRERFEASFRSIVGVADVPSDPWAQLRQAIEAVFRSWESDRARTYRQKEGIPEDLGTAVTVQAMVFGNRGSTSATGVLFTRDPATGEPALYGDVLFDAQGEDVVAGTHRTEPISVLDERLPRRGRRAAGGSDASRAPLPRPVRHRVHDRRRTALDAPGPCGEAQPRGGNADRGRHGRGRSRSR